MSSIFQLQLANMRCFLLVTLRERPSRGPLDATLDASNCHSMAKMMANMRSQLLTELAREMASRKAIRDASCDASWPPTLASWMGTKSPTDCGLSVSQPKVLPMAIERALRWPTCWPVNVFTGRFKLCCTVISRQHRISRCISFNFSWPCY